LTSLRKSMSPERFDPYTHKAGGDRELAAELYVYNSRVAEALLHPLNLIEVTLRNSIDRVLVKLHGHDWHLSQQVSDVFLMEGGANTLQAAVSRSGRNALRGDIIANLSFDFWSNMFRDHYGDFWRYHLLEVMPNLPEGVTRHDLQVSVKTINNLRNRVAHYEPILDMNVSGILTNVFKIVGYICKDTAVWGKHNARLQAVTRTRPQTAGKSSTPLSTRLDKNFAIISTNDSLLTALNKLDVNSMVAVIENDQKQIAGAASAKTFLNQIIQCSCQNGLEGMIDLSEISIIEILTDKPFEPWKMFPDEVSIQTVAAEFNSKTIKIAVGYDVESSKVSGVMLRAHRKY